MRDKHLSSSTFCSDLEEFMVKNIHESFLRTPVVDNSNFTFMDLYESGLNIPKGTLDEYICFAVVSWYIPPEIGCLIRLELDRVAKDPDHFILGFLLESKGQALCYLIETSLYHTRDFYGNILTPQNITKLFHKKLYRKRLTSNPLKPKRKRGYNDKGSLKSPHEVHSLWFSTQKQNQIEEERLTRYNTKLLLTGFVT